jgi:Tat protein secretion system quality control protein TatD with DNase activity
LSRVDWELLPESLKKLSVKKGKLFAEAGKAHYALVQRNFGRNPNDLTTAAVEANAALAAVVVKNFEEVQQIWDELDHFAKHRQALGNHPDFKAAAAQRRVSELSDVALLKLLRNRPADILKYTKTRIPAAGNEARRQRLEQKVAAWRTELEAAKQEAIRRKLKAKS